ncbi:MAG: nucleotidyltransferase family protein, partial [Hydrocarboniphaga effusa]|nr:nucleotidyltransferase family protein [Hydrocarboniphaga effusa]
RGERMRPLTDVLPKPMIVVAGKPLIQHHIENLRAAGVHQFVVNLGWHGEKIREALGDGSRLGVRIRYSEEGWPALESGGGIFHALHLLGTEPFIVVNGDVFADYPWPRLLAHARNMPAGDLAHLVLVPNPAHNPKGDFALENGRVSNAESARLTFSGLSLHRPEFFAGCTGGHFPLLPLWRNFAEQRRLSGEIYPGLWSDVGTRERLALLQHRLAGSAAHAG